STRAWATTSLQSAGVGSRSSLADEAATQAPEEPAVPPDPDHEAMLATLRAGLGADAIVDSAAVFGDLVVRVAPSAWSEAAVVAQRDLACDYLSFIAGIDWEPAAREGDEA